MFPFSWFFSKCILGKVRADKVSASTMKALFFHFQKCFENKKDWVVYSRPENHFHGLSHNRTQTSQHAFSLQHSENVKTPSHLFPASLHLWRRWWSIIDAVLSTQTPDKSDWWCDSRFALFGQITGSVWIRSVGEGIGCNHIHFSCNSCVFLYAGLVGFVNVGGGVLSDCLSFFISVVCQKNQRKLHQLFLTECCNQVANADSPFCRLPPPTPGSAPTLNFTQISSLSSELYNPLMKTDWCKKHQGIWRPFPSSPWCPRALRRKQQHTCNQRGVEFILLCWTHCAIPAEPIRRNARKAGVSSLTKSGLLWMTTTLEH